MFRREDVTAMTHETLSMQADPADPPASAWDIAVIGAGAAGLAAAICLARDGFDTVLVGAINTPRDGRTVALMDASLRFLRRLGVWERLEPDSEPMSQMRIVDDTGSLFRPPPVSFHAYEIGLDAFGHNIENATLVEGLAEAARATPRLRLIDGSVTVVSYGEAAAMVTLADGGRLTAKLVVAADGRRSLAREAAGIETKSWSYPQVAITCILGHERDHRDASTEFHTRQGPFTLVPLPGRRSSLVWMVAPSRAKALCEMDEAGFALAVERQAHSMLGAMRLEGPRGQVPMGGLSVSRYVGQRLALVGEAAHVFPPIGAQGLNLGLRDVAALRDALVNGRGQGDEPGARLALDSYDAGRQKDVSLRTRAVDALNRSLLSDLMPVDFARGLGLIALDTIGPLRRAVMRQGLAPVSGLPRLMQPVPREVPARGV
jgi:2-octaprenyl-6-methoxyphenol hydroxylase